MRTKLLLLFFALGEITASAQTDSLPNITKTSNGKLIDPIQIHEVVVTGTRNETDIRHLPMTISVIDRKQIEQSMQPSILPILTQQVPGLFITARGIMGYGVSGGAAGGMSLRGIGSGSGRLMVLIDGHPQYMGLMGHPIADAYQSLMAERVEVLRGPASVLYGSNAMGGGLRSVEVGDIYVAADIPIGRKFITQFGISPVLLESHISAMSVGSVVRTAYQAGKSAFSNAVRDFAL